MAHSKLGFNEKRQTFWGWILISPLCLGLTLWVAFPMGLSFFTSLAKWDMLSKAQFVGFKNYISIFTEDELFLKSIRNTLYFTFLSVPLQMITALAGALLLNSQVKGKRVFRTIFYLPSLIPLVVSSVMWLWLFNNQYGLINYFLHSFGINRIQWIDSKEMVIPSLTIMNVWNIGNVIIIFLAGLQGIPNDLMEAVDIDGGTYWHKFRYVMLPLLSPIILYNMIVNMIKCLQLFVEPYIMTNGGPVNSSLSFVLHIYNNAFKYGKMGTANAMAWVLFILTMGISLLIFKTSTLWTYYEGDK
ncbi:carbohydrate ABC transporter permease [Sphaerochaeta globosa]|uniref:ABC-type transporter, integral membrane subunit n=1 Tax=Sphaerochaeta globosa (strain ATCC BAA-1886 / DSM 22777 / Buddy) TaxID=158189 RepID=F0RY89_SPHGB|nr:sugar ABC transporter permease [Sphaerochaeta globosa]ADY12588.1 ABC-type transporter, integral membrane subunit [Sphaerochaeta globosa str. Buddy]